MPSCPFSDNVHHGQIKHLEETVIYRENGLGLGHFPQLAVEVLNGVGGIDQSPDLLGALEICTQIGPVIPPGTGNLGVFLVLVFSGGIQCIHSSRFDRRSIDRLEVGHEGFQVLAGYISGGIAEPVDDVVLHLRFGKHGLNGGREAEEVVCTGDKYIFRPAVPQTVE